MNHSALRAVLLASLLGAGSVGCVAQSQYVETRDALVREQAGHHETVSQLASLGADLKRLQEERDVAQAKLANQEAKLRAAEQLLAQLRLDVHRAAQEREAANELVEQLRTELGRVGTHLRAYSEQRDAVQASLEAAEAKLAELANVERDAAQRASMVRDLSVALHEPVSAGKLELVLVEGAPALRIDRHQFYRGPAFEEPAPEGEAVLAAVAQVAMAHPEATVQVSEVGTARDEGQSSRLEGLSRRLVAQGVAASHVVVTTPQAGGDDLAKTLGETGPARVELVILPAS